MINKIISFSIRNKFLIGMFTFALIGWGIYSLQQLPIDAVPDITNNQVQIISIAPTLAANEVEQFVSAPIEVSVANIPDVIELRSISRLGLSLVTVVFKENVDVYWARQQITERLSDAEDMIPAGITKPELAPISTGLGEIYQYVLHVKHGYEGKYTPAKLRTVQDWIVRRELLGTPGVADVNSYGGFLEQYEVAVNPDKLKSMGVTMSEIFEAMECNNENTGSAYIDKKPNAYFIRGLGLVNGIEDIENIVVKTNDDGIPVLIRDLAKVQMGSAPRYGAFIVDTSGEAVGGVVMMLKGANASRVVEDVKERIEIVQKSLPEGIEIEPYLDRTHLVDRAVGTVSENLILGGLIVIFVLVLLLGNLRAGLIVASVIPLSMLFAISLMNLFGVSGNLMSLGAIDFGLIVDGAVIIVENVVHRITLSRTHHVGVLKLNREQMDNEVLQSSKRMMSSATFGQIIILIVYLPILALVGIEGKMFRPMAETVSFAILGALILSLTYVPVASTLFLSKKTTHKKNISDWIMNGISKVFNPLLELSLKRKFAVIMTSVLLFAASIFVFDSLGGEFMPTLEEGDLAAGVITLQGSSLSNTIDVVKKANKILMDKFPEVIHAVCKIGTGEIPTDPTPMETGDYIITMKDKSEWTSAETREEMMEKMEMELSVLAGVKFEFQQPIAMRFNELMSGSKQDVAVKIFGDNLDTLAVKALVVEKIISTIDGVEDINVEKVTGSGQVQVKYDREKLARYGLNISDINKLLTTAFAGTSAGVVYEEEKRIDMVVRLDSAYRTDISYIKNLNIPLASGNQITLDQVADIDIKNGTAQVSRESTKRRITVGFNVRGRDVETVIEEVKSKIDKMKMPAGYYTTFGGQFENLVTAKKRLYIAVPVALLLIFILLFFAFGSIKKSLLIYTAVPLSAIGGIMALFLRDMNFSISAGIGFIALFGVSVLNGIVLISEFNRLEKEDCLADIYEIVRKGIKIRLRPVIMTAAVASLGFLPMALSNSAGAEVQKPLATVVIGGLISSTFLTLLVIPVLYLLVFGGKKKFPKPIKTMIVVFIGSFLLFSYNRVKAQKVTVNTYTLEQAVSKALSDNGAVKSGSMTLDMQKKLKGGSWDLDKASLDYEYGQSNSYYKDNNITIAQSMAFPSVYIYQNKVAKANVKSSEYQLSITKSMIAKLVKQNYYMLAYCHAKSELLQKQDSLYSNFLKATALKAEKGESTLLEKITAEARVSEIKTKHEQLAYDMAIYLANLQLLLNEQDSIEINDKMLPRLSFLGTADSNATDGNPSLGWMNAQAEVALMEKKVENAKLLPDISFGYFSLSNQELSSTDRFTGIQAGITIPLWFFSQKSKILASGIKAEIARNDAAYFQSTVYNEYLVAMQQFRKFATGLDYYENTALKQSELIISQAFISYKSGDIGYVEFIQSMDDAIEIQSNYLEALSDYDQSVIELEAITGKIN